MVYEGRGIDLNGSNGEINSRTLTGSNCSVTMGGFCHYNCVGQPHSKLPQTERLIFDVEQ